mmetsp:Transcript_90132/g.188458  ORF Transcript_90132/g.188458 Transcript_90132/m.188458 type:complete len:213 (-) Transcript_90132:2005-2643(-)
MYTAKARTNNAFISNSAEFTLRKKMSHTPATQGTFSRQGLPRCRCTGARCCRASLIGLRFLPIETVAAPSLPAAAMRVLAADHCIAPGDLFDWSFALRTKSAMRCFPFLILFCFCIAVQSLFQGLLLGSCFPHGSSFQAFVGLSSSLQPCQPSGTKILDLAAPAVVVIGSDAASRTSGWSPTCASPSTPGLSTYHCCSAAGTGTPKHLNLGF